MDSKTKEALKIVFDYLAIKDKPQKAAELYKKGCAKYIVMVGVEGTFSDLSWKEGQFATYKSKLSEHGVPESVIIAELERLKIYEKKGDILPQPQKFPKEVISIWKFLESKVETRF